MFGSSNSKKYNKFTHINFVKFFIIFEIIVLLILAVFPQKSVSAKSSSDKFYENTFEIIDELNTEELENLFNENSYYNSIKGNSFKEKLKNLLSQNITEGNFFSSIISNLIINFSKFLPFFIILFIIAVFSGMIETIKPNGVSFQMTNMVSIVCYLCAVSILITQFVKTSQEVTTQVKNLSSQMQIVMPLIFSLMSVTGFTTSIAIYRPIVLILSNSIISFIFSFLIPLVSALTVINVVSQLTDKIRLTKLREIFSTIFKWTIGITLTIFSLFLSVKGIYASKADGVSLSAIKYLSSQVPVIGGFLKEGTDIFIASSQLIKNGLGKMSVFIIFWEILSPSLALLIFMFGLNIVAGLCEPFADSKIVNLYSSISRSFGYLLSIILMVSFMYVLVLILIICSTTIL